MKTPRDILLARHRAAEPKLNALRQRAVAALESDETQTASRTKSLMAVWLDFFRLPRVAWGGLAAAWVAIIVLNVASSERPQRVAPQQESKRSPEMLQALREQKRLFTELVGAAGGNLESEAPRFIPKPRSERPHETSAV